MIRSVPTRMRLAFAFTRWAALLSVAAVGWPAHSAAAASSGGAECKPEAKVKAKQYYAEGETRFRLNELQKAIENFKLGYAACPEPLFLYNLALANRQLKDNEKALFFYKQYLSTGATDRRVEVQDWVAQLERLIEQQSRTAQAPPPGPASPYNSAAAPAVAAMPSSSSVPKPADTELSRKPVYKKAWFWITIIGGAAVVGTGVALALTLPNRDRDPAAGFGVVMAR